MHEKEKGELAESKFMSLALEKGFVVSVPFGDSSNYDFVLDFNGKLNRVQVKSVFSKHEQKDRYVAKTGWGCNKVPYTDVDVVVVFVQPEDAWYMIPIHQLKGINCCVYPHRESEGLYEEFKNAWYILTKEGE